MSELTKELTIESFYEYDKMDPVKRKAIESQLFKSSQVKKYQEKYIKKVMKKYEIENSEKFQKCRKKYLLTPCSKSLKKTPTMLKSVFRAFSKNSFFSIFQNI
mgnify:CR=1 FL=1